MRLRAAIEAAPYVHPKLSATAIVPVKDFAAILEQRVKRIADGKIGLNSPVNVIEHAGQPAKVNVAGMDDVHTFRCGSYN